MVVLVFIVLVGVPVFSYLALNIARVAGTNQVTAAGNTVKSADESTNPVFPSQSAADSLQSKAKPSPAEENSAAPPAQ